MRSRLLITVLSMLLLAHVGLLQAAAPVGSTISLYSTYTGFYVEMDPGRDNALIALNSTSVGTNEEFIVEDAGNGNILLKSAANSKYARADTSETTNILRAETTSTTDPLTHFKWIENSDGTISFRNDSLSRYVRIQGVNQYLKTTKTSITEDTKFTWGVVGGVDDTDPPTPNAATFATAPVAVSSKVITMTATTGSDATGPVEYYFAETSGNAGGSDSGWQISSGYSDGGLSPETEYTYTVKMRDGVTPIPNVGSTSEPASATTGTGSVSQRPNIVFILADDLGTGDLACYGHPHMRTPELDNLATEGIRFEGFHVTGITCNPSRAGFMTSRHPASFAGETSAQGFSGRATITELMHKAGYKVGHFGKWHIGPVEKTGTYGIDDLAVIGGNNSTIDGRDAGLFAAAKDFITENKDVPFYVNVWGHISHSPVDPHDDLVALFNDFTLDRDDYNYGSYWQQYKFDLAQEIIDFYSLPEDLTMGMRNYMADVWSLDVQVGLLLDKLDELGLRDNTIVVFSSDQGAAPVWTLADIVEDNRDPDISKNMLGTGGVWSGGKHTQLEGGVRSPFIIRWPGNVPAGVVNTTSTISALDWLPTMCSMAGIDIGSLQVEGEDVTDILLGATRSPDRALFWKTHASNSPPSMLDGLEGRWKMHAPKLAKNDPDELFDLEADPEELIDVLSANPGIAGSMSAAIDAWVSTLPISEFDGNPPVTPLSPSASAGADQQVYDLDSNGAEPVTLDASASSDDGYISGYIWRESGQIIGLTDGPTISLPLGTHTIEVEVTDYAGNTDFDSVTITISTSPGLEIADLRQLCRYWLNDCSSPDWCQSMDINHDKKVNLQDLAHLANLWIQ